MKKIIFLLLSIIHFYTYSQTLDALKINAQKTYDYTAKQDFNGILDLTYPKLFTIAPRESMLEILENTFNGNPDFKIKMLSVAPNFQFGPIKKLTINHFVLSNTIMP